MTGSDVPPGRLPGGPPPPDVPDPAAGAPALDGAASAVPEPEAARTGSLPTQPPVPTQPAAATQPSAPTPPTAPVLPAGPGHPAAPAHPTAPIATRPPVAARSRGSLTRMGPWAPVAGALLGGLLGAVAVLLLAGAAVGFRDRLALVLLVVGMVLLGASGPLLADEVRLVRRGARDAAVRPAWVEATAGLLNGLTPARLLLLLSGFVLFLAAYVSRG